MIKGLQGRTKVSKKIKPLPVKERQAPNLVCGNDYYVSFGISNAYPCKLLEIINEYEKTEVRIGIEGKSRKKILNRSGNSSTFYAQEHILYANEIGATPDEAVKNEVHW